MRWDYSTSTTAQNFRILLLLLSLRKNRDFYLSLSRLRTMTESFPDTIHLDDPQAASSALLKMMSSNPDDPSISEAEMNSLAQEIQAGKEARANADNRSSEDWVPRKEGTSGSSKAPTIEPQSKTALTFPPDQDEPDTAAEVSSNADAGEFDHDTARVLSGSSSGQPAETGHNFVTEADLDMVVTTIDELIADRLEEVRRPLEAEVEKLRQDVQGSSRAVSNLTTRLADLAIRLDEATRKALQVTVKSDPEGSASQQPIQAGPETPAPVKARPASITEVPSAKPQTTAVQGVLDATPLYPKVQAVRKAKMSRLAAQVGFKPPKGDISPREWTVDGIMSFLTRE